MNCFYYFSVKRRLNATDADVPTLRGFANILY